MVQLKIATSSDLKEELLSKYLVKKVLLNSATILFQNSQDGS